MSQKIKPLDMSLHIATKILSQLRKDGYSGGEITNEMADDMQNFTVQQTGEHIAEGISCMKYRITITPIFPETK